MIISFRLINMRYQKISEKADGIIELTSETLYYKHRFSAEEPIDKEDVEMGWEKIENIFERTIRRRDVRSVELEFLDTTQKNKEIDANKWVVRLQINGVNTDTAIYYRKEEDARKMVDTLTDWWLTGETK